jgi:hypothetical protein
MDTQTSFPLPIGQHVNWWNRETGTLSGPCRSGLLVVSTQQVRGANHWPGAPASR